MIGVEVSSNGWMYPVAMVLAVAVLAACCWFGVPASERAMWRDARRRRRAERMEWRRLDAMARRDARRIGADR